MLRLLLLGPIYNNTACNSTARQKVEGCGLITQKPGRNLLFHSDLEALHLDDFTISHKLHAYLLNDALLLTLPQRKRTKSTFAASANLSNSNSNSNTALNRLVNNPLLAAAAAKSSSSYQYKFHAFYELQDIKIMGVDDSKEVRNAFQLLKFPESVAFRCGNAHLKKEWLESCENAKKQLAASSGLGAAVPGSGALPNTIDEEDEDGEPASFNHRYIIAPFMAYRCTGEIFTLSIHNSKIKSHKCLKFLLAIDKYIFQLLKIY